MTEEVAQLAQYGAVGISLAVIVVFGFFIKVVFDFMAKHIDKNTDVLGKLLNIITRLEEKIK